MPSPGPALSGGSRCGKGEVQNNRREAAHLFERFRSKREQPDVVTANRTATMAPSQQRSAEASVDPLVARLVRGDPFAMTKVYERHHRRVRSFARRMVGDAAAEDLVQDVFMALPKAMRNFRGDCSLETFLLSIAANRSRRHARSLFRFRRAVGRAADEPSSERSGDAEEGILQSELRAALERGLAKLSHDQRVAFVLCSVEGHTSVEAALILGVPEGTVRTRLFHARQKLRDHLKRQGYG